MMRALLLATLVLPACSVWNATDACDAQARETRVNERGDQLEYLGNSQSIDVLADGRIVAAYVSTTTDQTSSEVRFAYIDPDAGNPVPLCSGTQHEIVVSDTPKSADDPAHLAYAATVAAVDVPNPAGGEPAVAAVGWTIGPPDAPQLRIRFVDAGGCFIGTGSFEPVLSTVTGPVTGLSLEWSASRRALLATFQDGRRVLGAWIEAFGSASNLLVFAEEDLVVGGVASALAPDGRGLVAWKFIDAADLESGQFGYRAVLVDEDGAVRSSALAGGSQAAFRVDDVDSEHRSGRTEILGIAAAAADDRYALAFEATRDLVPYIEVRELDSLDGAPLRLAGGDGGPVLVDHSDSNGQASASAGYLPNGSLLVLWESARPDGGTFGRLYGTDGSPRFSAVSCDEEPFPVGARANTLPGTSSIVAAPSELWIAHAGDPTDDPVATGVLAWRMPLSELWPAK